MIMDPLRQSALGSILQIFFEIVGSFWPCLAGLGILALIRNWVSAPQFKGWVGEKLTSHAILRRLNPRIYQVLNDIYLPRPDGKGTTQMDHVVVSPFGIFVIETKNFSGWIFGSANSREWTQIIYRKKVRFQNPIHQNALHIGALAAALELPKELFHNLVFFIGDVTLKTDLPTNVITKGFYSHLLNWRTPLIPKEDCQMIVSRLKLIQRDLRKGQVRQKHIADRRLAINGKLTLKVGERK